MIIETKNKTINLVLKTRKIVDIANLLKNKNFEEVFIKALLNNHIKTSYNYENKSRYN